MPADAIHASRFSLLASRRWLIAISVSLLGLMACSADLTRPTSQGYEILSPIDVGTFMKDVGCKLPSADTASKLQTRPSRGHPVRSVRLWTGADESLFDCTDATLPEIIAALKIYISSGGSLMRTQANSQNGSGSGSDYHWESTLYDPPDGWEWLYIGMVTIHFAGDSNWTGEYSGNNDGYEFDIYYDGGFWTIYAYAYNLVRTADYDEGPDYGGDGGGDSSGNGNGGDSGGGSSGGGSSGPTPEEAIAALLDVNPYALLDIPCSELPKWTSLATMTVPNSVITRLSTESVLNGSQIQYLTDAKGPTINLDYYAVTVPVADIPGGLSVDAYLNKVRTHLNDFVDPPTHFNYYPGLTGEEQRWTGSDPLGTVFSITLMPLLEDGSVVATSYDSTQWVFSTVRTPADYTHPVSGNRQFGALVNNDTVTFYTRGTDRVSTRLNSYTDLVGRTIFEHGDDVWQSFQDHIKDDLGSSATKVSPVVFRPNWDKYNSVLSGLEPASSLGCTP